MWEQATARTEQMDSLVPLDILVIEDDAHTRENLRDILELDDHRVSMAGSAADVQQLKDWSRFAAIILDRRLPDATAEQLMPCLKAAAPGAEVIVVTGYSDIQGAIAALQQGASDYLLKPLNADLLRASLRRIAERRQLAQALREAQERALQSERLAAIGEMVTGLAHESRNALQRSQACLEMLALTVNDRPKALDLIKRLQEAQDHLHTLYEDVRSYASPINLEKEPCDLREIWREAWQQLEPIRREKQAILNEGHNCTDLNCAVDRFRLGQVFRNIFENALAACSPPVVIDVRAASAELDGRPALCARVHDNGPGISALQRRKIFDPFFTTKAKGTGLGMAIAKRIVEAHGGQIAIGDDDVPGAVFLLTLPKGLS
jgi:signal transduction histidine kinase